MWWSIGGGIIIFALGMFIFLKPGLIWKLTEEWKSYCADEPSEFYIKLDIENPIIRINTAFKGCSSLEKISVLPRIYHN